jgi:hypothetical protein
MSLTGGKHFERYFGDETEAAKKYDAVVRASRTRLQLLIDYFLLSFFL